jgi:hypothetical protein
MGDITQAILNPKIPGLARLDPQYTRKVPPKHQTTSHKPADGVGNVHRLSSGTLPEKFMRHDTFSTRFRADQGQTIP